MQPAGVMDGRSTVKEGGLARLLERFSIVSSLLEFDERSLKGRERERDKRVRFVDWLPHENTAIKRSALL